MTLQPASRQLSITWLDTFSAETGYKIEVRNAAGAWETVEALAASPSTGTTYQWQRVIDSSRTYRVTATHPNYSVPLQTDAGVSDIPIELVPQPMSLELDQESPLRGIVQLSIANPQNVQWVDYYIDLTLLASVDTAPSFATDWNVVSVPDGNHLVVASVRQTSGARVELRREVVVDNPAVAVMLTYERVNLGGRDLSLRARATADAGIQSVQFLVNDNPLQTVTTQTGADTYVHVVSAEVLAGLPAGPNTFKAIATDNDQATAEAVLEIPIDNPPTLTLATPFDGAIVSGQLHVQGSFGDDNPGAVLRLTLGDVQIHQQSTAGAIDFNYPVNSLGAGEYTFTAAVMDSQGKQTTRQMNVIVTSSPLTYQLVSRNAEVLATFQGALLYRKFDGTVIWRAAGGTETTLQLPAGLSNVGNWQMDDAHVVMSAMGPAPNAGALHVYRFDASGQATNISQPLSLSRTENPLLRSPWVIWTNGVSQSYSIYNLDTDAHILVPVPPAASTLGNWRYDFVPTPGSEQFFFWAQTGGSGTLSTYDIFRYRLDNGTTAILTSGGSKQTYVQADTTRAAWQKSPADRIEPPFELTVAPTANPTSTTTLSSTMISFALSDQTLAWLEGTSDPRVLKVDDGVTTTVTTNASNVAPVTADGHVIFNEGGKVYSWSRSAGKRLLLDTLPARPAQQDDGVAFLTTGAESFSVYRVELP
jgi:hypothetical protein